MYQAWQQGNEDYASNWLEFVKLAAKWDNTSVESMTATLLKYSWFKTNL
jgi:hypothetical protein